MTEPTKRYLNINRFVTDLPRHFINSPNKKYIEVVDVSLFIDDNLIDDVIEAFHEPKFISFHADFVQEHRELDQHVQFANKILTKRKKYQMLTTMDRIEIWFTDITGQKLNKNNLVLDEFGFYIQTNPDRKIKFVVELLLVY